MKKNNKFKLFNSSEKEILTGGLNELYEFYEKLTRNYKNKKQFNKDFIKSIEKDFNTVKYLLV